MSFAVKNSFGLAPVLCLCALTLAACGSRSLTKAPVEDRSTGRVASRAGAPVAPAQSENSRPLRGLENAGKPGYYTVQRGDTLARIALDQGQSWRDVARWNNLDNPNLIEVGEVLRVQPPAGEAVVVARPITSGLAQATPLPPSGGPAPVQVAPPGPSSPGSANSASSASSTSSPAPTAPNSPAPAAADELTFAWPARGSLLASFDEAKNKGLDIAGKAGDPVLAAADGRVVYAGSDLRGYGNLVILQHNKTYLTAYAHNQTLLVKEDQTVKQGQKIAEMGSTDADRVKLHFEVRRMGRPVDPARYLPAR